ncbi:MAG: hypothetical protein N2595_05465 [bacterium]|nr:hypothetical protein [bacterium]
MTAPKLFRTLLPLLTCSFALSLTSHATPPPTGTRPSLPPSPTFTLNARVFVTGKAARQQGPVGTTQLKGTERGLTTYLTYRDYRLVQKGSSSVTLNQPFSLPLQDNVTLSITVISFNRDLIKIQVLWKLPGLPDLNTKLNVVRNRPAMIGGPRHPAGGIYLLSLTIN